MADSEILYALNFDALSEAERMTGKSYKSDHDTEMIGVGLHLLHGERKRDLLRQAGDTYWAQPMPEWMAVVEGLGFQLIHSEPIPESEDVYRIWWRDDGLLLKADSYWGDKSINSANVYFNYCGPRNAMHKCSSGHAGQVEGVDVWEGSSDAREGLRFGIERMEAEGRFVSPWMKTGFLWLLHYQDSKVPGYDYGAITERRIDALPEHVRNCVRGEPSHG